VWAAAATQSDVTFRLFDPATGKAERDWTAPGRWAEAVALSPDAKVLAVAFKRGVIQLVRRGDRKDVTPAADTAPEVTGLRFTPDGKHLVTVSDDRTARTWDAATGKELAVRDGLGSSPGCRSTGRSYSTRATAGSRRTRMRGT